MEQEVRGSIPAAFKKLYMVFHLFEEMNQMVNKSKHNSSNSLVFGLWPQTKTTSYNDIKSSILEIHLEFFF